jgi:hypothetical protein
MPIIAAVPNATQFRVPTILSILVLVAPRDGTAHASACDDKR